MVKGFKSSQLRMQAVICVLLCVVLSGVGSAQRNPDPADDPAAVAWAAGKYAILADRLFGEPHAIGLGAVSSKSTSVVVVRVRPAHDNLERQVVIMQLSNGELKARVSTAMDSSLYQQLLSLHVAHLDWGLEQISSAVRVRHRDLTGVQISRRLKRAMHEFAMIRTNVLLSNALVSDPSTYRVSSFAGSQWLEVNLNGSPLATDPVIRWAEELLRISEPGA